MVNIHKKHKGLRIKLLLSLPYIISELFKFDKFRRFVNFYKVFKSRLTFLGKCDMVLYVRWLLKDNYKLSYVKNGYIGVIVT